MSDTESRAAAAVSDVKPDVDLDAEAVPAEGEPTNIEEEEEITAMKKRVAEMEAEASKLREMQASLAQKSHDANESREDIDSRSVFVGNVDYSSSPEEIQEHFASCGAINRVTILLDKFTGQPKGYAYVEFSEPSFVAQALVLNESMFKGRNIKVTPKRTNVPGMARGRGGPGASVAAEVAVDSLDAVGSTLRVEATGADTAGVGAVGLRRIRAVWCGD